LRRTDDLGDLGTEYLRGHDLFPFQSIMPIE
jgi:hypothetical protein